MKEDDPLYVAGKSLAERMGIPFNFILVNRYKDGDDALSHHADDERDLAPGVPIVILSVGASRTMEFKRKVKKKSRKRTRPQSEGGDTNTNKDTMRAGKTRDSGHKRENGGTIRMLLNHGDVLVMAGTTQQLYTHAIPRPNKSRREEPMPFAYECNGVTVTTKCRYSLTLREMVQR